MDRFSIAQAYAQLEADYNVGGWLRERPSNRRRMESIGCQLARIGYSNPYGWVDIVAPYGADDDSSSDHEVREIYMRKVLDWGLPIDADLMAQIKSFFVPEFIAGYPQCAGADHLQGR